MVDTLGIAILVLGMRVGTFGALLAHPWSPGILEIPGPLGSKVSKYRVSMVSVLQSCNSGWGYMSFIFGYLNP